LLCCDVLDGRNVKIFDFDFFFLKSAAHLSLPWQRRRDLPDGQMLLSPATLFKRLIWRNSFLLFLYFVWERRERERESDEFFWLATATATAVDERKTQVGTSAALLYYSLNPAYSPSPSLSLSLSLSLSHTHNFELRVWVMLIQKRWSSAPAIFWTTCRNNKKKSFFVSLV
jgi:hypothetical protein